MVGVTRDEWQGFLSGNYPMSVADYESAVTADYGADAPQLLEKYPADAAATILVCPSAGL